MGKARDEGQGRKGEGASGCRWVNCLVPWDAYAVEALSLSIPVNHLLSDRHRRPGMRS